MPFPKTVTIYPIAAILSPIKLIKVLLIAGLRSGSPGGNPNDCFILIVGNKFN